MNKTLFILALALCLALGMSASAEPESQMPPPYKGSAAFETLKELAGEWTGTHQVGDREMAAKVTYEVSAPQRDNLSPIVSNFT